VQNPDPTDSTAAAARTGGLAEPILATLGQAVERLRFGVVQLTVHDGKVVQLDVTEKHRF
jgi:hypothetical protein